MSDDPKVEIQSDTGEKLQWGVGLLFFRDGGKWTLKKKATFGIGFFVIVVISVIQCFDLDSHVIPVGNSTILIPSALSPQKMIHVSEAPKQSANAKKNSNKQRKLAGPELLARPRDLKLIPPGSMLKAVLLSGASNGLIRAAVREPLTVNGNTFIEEGSTLLGNGSSSEERLYVSFTQIVFQDGSFGQISAQACDSSDQIVGLKGSKIGTKTVNILGSIGLGFVGGMAEGLQDTQGQQGVALRPPTIKNALMNATSRTALEQSQGLMSDLKNQQPIIEVPAGTEICLIFGNS